MNNTNYKVFQYVIAQNLL